MNKMKKCLALLLAAAMSVGMLAGCGGGSEAEAEAENPGVSVEAEPVDLSKITDPTDHVSGLAADTVVATVGEHEITADMLMYWFNYVASYTMQQYSYNGVSTVDWASDMGEGRTVAQGVMDSALELAAYYTLLPTRAGEEFGLETDPADLEDLEEDLKQAETELGSAEKAKYYMWMNMTTTDLYRRLVSAASVEMQMQDQVFGEGGEREPTDAEVLAYATDDLGYYGAKHILLMTVSQDEYVYDDEGNPIAYAPLDDATVAEKKALADDLAAQLAAAEDPVALFDTLMNEYSEDTGLAAYPDGYTAYSGQMVTAFEEAALALKDGEISPVVESEYGYHIIMRVPLDPEDFEAAYISAKVDELARGWLAEVELTTNDSYAAIDAADTVEKMMTLQETIYYELYPAEDETAAEDAASAEVETEPAE